MRLILYSKPGCHLCEGLAEKLAQVRSPQIAVEVRDITTREDWFQAYQYEIPVLCRAESGGDAETATLHPLPRLSPRATVSQLEQMLQKYSNENKSE